jgi:acetylglutamate kinase
LADKSQLTFCIEKKYMKVYIIKIGGNIIDDETKLSTFLGDFAGIEGRKILVHGGGKMASRVGEGMGVAPVMIEGRRVTDAETLKIVTMVYAGFINKNIVALLQANKCHAVGLSGADGNSIRAHKRVPGSALLKAGADYGFAGDIDEVNAGFLKGILDQELVPVFSPITHDAKGQLLNTNADTIAQELAKALSAHYETTLVYCFEKEGVLMDAAKPDSVIPILSAAAFEDLRDKKIVAEGMVPKLQNAFEALAAGVAKVVIGHAAKLQDLINGKSGTTIVNE